MNATAKTVIYVVVAVALAVIAGMSAPGGVEPVFFDDVGEPFFPHLQKAEQATSLEIWGFDAEAGGAVPFSVKNQGGTWAIPSHYDYPADAKDRMAKAAGLFVGLTRASVRSDRAEDHEQFGVIDPKDEGLELEGRGMRVTFKDASGGILADLILGKEVEGKSDVRYVRLADKKRTYTAKLPGELTTKFEDWIERDLLKVSSFDIENVVFDNYSVDERRGVVVPGEKLSMVKSDDKWTLGDLAATEEFVTEKGDESVRTITDLKIVDVRRKPDGLTARLEQAQGIKREILMDHLARRGFFLAQGKLFSNEGDLFVHTKKGVTYTLKFGEILYGTGDAVEASNGKEGEEGGKSKGESEKGPERRYLMITAAFDEKLLDAPAGTPLAQEQLDKRAQAREQVQKIAAAVRAWVDEKGALPGALAELTAGESPRLEKLDKDPWDQDYVLIAKETKAPEPAPEGEETEAKPVLVPKPEFAVVSYGEDKADGGEGAGTDIASDQLAREDELQKTFDDHVAHSEKVEEGQKEAGELSKRFGPWYYVIDAESFGKLHLVRGDLVKPKEAEANEGAGEGATTTEAGKE